MKWVIRTLAVLAVIAIAGVLFRDQIVLEMVGVLSKLRLPVGPPREITWDRGPLRAAQPAGERPPNIVLILADDLGWNDLTFGSGGVADGTVPTPRIDSIAAEGVSFRNGYAGNGTCAPSRAAIMTGRYPSG